MLRTARSRPSWRSTLLNIAALALAAAGCSSRNSATNPHEPRTHATCDPLETAPRRLYPWYASREEITELNRGCLSCHAPADGSPATAEYLTMHPTAAGTDGVYVSCSDCHGGNTDVYWSGEPLMVGEPPALTREYMRAKQAAHGVHPRYPEAWADPETGEYTSANPIRSYTLLNYEDPEFIRFVNPGDLRIAHQTCGQCHPSEVERVRKSMMTHGAQLWGAALYNNGSYPLKLPRFGESYSVNGVPQRIYTVPPPDAGARARGVLDYLDPLPRWEISQMGNILRAFERGGRVSRAELPVGLPNIFDEPGRPDMKLSDRGLGTQLSTDPVFLGIQKTRLLDPILSMLGTNDHPGDYRSSGCSACHVLYANDRFPAHSGPIAEFGNRGTSSEKDPTVSAGQPGHPIRHTMTSAIPSSQCVVCHVHPGTSFANTYLGYTWWDNETHGEVMYPSRQVEPTAEQYVASLMSNPESTAVRGLWSNLWPEEPAHTGRPAGDHFLENLTEKNRELTKLQFADFHGHGWIFRAIFKQDRKGNLLDAAGAMIPAASLTAGAMEEAIHYPTLAQYRERTRRALATGLSWTTDPERAGHPVHLKDIHLEAGMHCIDCHFEQDAHGDGSLYGEVRNAIEIDCVDCHGTIREPATLLTSGPAGGNNLRGMYTPFKKRRFYWEGKLLKQRSSVIEDLTWDVPQIAYSVDPNSEFYNERAAYAKTLRRGSQTWGDAKCPESELAHANSEMACYTCHTSWMTSCFGCHLPMRSNARMPMLHNEGQVLRNYTTYNYQVLRDDVFMLGIDSTVKQGKIAPVRSSSAVVVGSGNANREWLYSQQQTISSDGYSGQAFNPHFPHAVRRTETKTCTDCHVSETNDNNAWMAQLLLQGTNFVNFFGRYVYVAKGEEGFEAVVVTERDEPQAVLGSDLHALAYPANFKKHEARGRILREAYEHRMNDGLLPGRGEILDLQLRGEYVYAARGKNGFYAYDVANIDNKGFSERIITAPVSPLGQSLHVKTKYATSVASPTTLGVDPTRVQNPINQEQPIHPIYAYLYVSDLYEGLVIIGAGTLLDGDPTNNFLKRATSFNPGGILDGAQYVTIAGNWAYVCCSKGVVIVDLTNPEAPKIAAAVGEPAIRSPRAVAVQFRYAFVTDADGLKVIDVTNPRVPTPLANAAVSLAEANRLYVARTFAYIAAGRQGLAIVDIEQPDHPRLDQFFTADGELNDARDVKVGMTNAGVYAYVADGHNGLRVLQLISPKETPGFSGFSPRPTPKLIAAYPTHGPALAISKGLDRDRAVDESGNQTAVFGRIGSRPFNLEEQQRLYLRDSQVYHVNNGVPPKGNGPR